MAYSKQEIAYLLRSGFSLGEIMQTDGITVSQPEPAADPQPEPVPVPQPEPVPVPQPVHADNADVLAAIEKLTQTIQAGNIRAGGFSAPTPEATADSILANIINPPGYTGN